MKVSSLCTDMYQANTEPIGSVGKQHAVLSVRNCAVISSCRIMPLYLLGALLLRRGAFDNSEIFLSVVITRSYMI
jgi:hypothetical protein